VAAPLAFVSSKGAARLRYSMLMTQATPTPAEAVPMEVVYLVLNGEGAGARWR
jgi:hypothetical protein